MKLVQVGILVALIVVGGLLFMVYRGQQAPQAVETPATQEPLPAAAALSEPPPAQTPSPPPASGSRRFSKAASSRAEVRPGPAPAAAAPSPVAEAAEPAPAPVVAAAPEPLPAHTEPPPPPPPPQPRTVTIAAGTLLSARLVESISTDKAKPGDTFAATLDRPLVVDGLAIAERGARVEGVVEEAEQAGRLRGVARLSVRLVRLLTSDGQRLDIQTDLFTREGETSKREDATKVGAGAGIGAAIGAIAGGGKGAAIGAAIGGAAGAGTVAATRGKPAVLPVETRIDFRLSRPVTVTEQR